MQKFVTISTIMVAFIATALLMAQPCQADEFCNGLAAALSQPWGFGTYKGELGYEDKVLGFTNWQSKVVLDGSNHCELMYGAANDETAYTCNFTLPKSVIMQDYMVTMANRAAACIAGASAVHYDVDAKRIYYVVAPTGNVIISDDSWDHHTLTTLVQQVRTATKSQ